MKKLQFLVILVCFTSLLPGQALALSLSLSANPPVIKPTFPGNLTNVVLDISGLTAGGPDSLGAFDLDVTFDDSVLELHSVIFGTSLGDEGLGEAITFVDSSTAGVVGLDEVSLLFDFELDAIQGESFTLANIILRGIAKGSSNLGLENVVLSDAFGFQLPDPTLQGANVSVPEPATLFLLASGFAAMGLWRVRARRLRKK
jgi:hypothetical protein